MSSPSPITHVFSLSLEDRNEDSLPTPSVTVSSRDVSSSLPPNHSIAQDSEMSSLEQSDISPNTMGIPSQEFVSSPGDTQADSSTVVLLLQKPEPGEMSNEPRLRSPSISSSSSVSDSVKTPEDFDPAHVPAQLDLPVTVQSSSMISDPESEKLAALGARVTSAEPGVEIQFDNPDVPEPSPESPSVEFRTVGDSAAVQLLSGVPSPDQQSGVSHGSKSWTELAVSILRQAESFFSTQETAEHNPNDSVQPPDQIQNPLSPYPQELSAEESASTPELPESSSSSQEIAENNLNISDQTPDRMHSSPRPCPQELPAEESASTLQLSELSSSTEITTESTLNVSEQLTVFELRVAELELRVAEQSIMADNIMDGSDTPPPLSVLPSASIQPPTHLELPSTSSMKHTAMHYGVAYPEYHSTSMHLSSATGATLHPQLGNLYPTPALQYRPGYCQVAPQFGATYLAPHPQYIASFIPQYPQLSVNHPPQEALVHANYPPPDPQASISGWPPKPPNLDPDGPAQRQNTPMVDMETGPCQGFSLGLYKKYKLWQQYRPRACMYFSSSHDSDALACFFV